MPSRLKIYFDGGCRPNPGAMEIAVVAGGQTWIQRDLGWGTSLDAKWRALIESLKIAQSLGAADFVLLGDSATVVAQAKGTAKCRGVGPGHREAFRALSAAGGPPRIRRIKRSQNLAGIALARQHPR